EPLKKTSTVVCSLQNNGNENPGSPHLDLNLTNLDQLGRLENPYKLEHINSFSNLLWFFSFQLTSLNANEKSVCNESVPRPSQIETLAETGQFNFGDMNAENSPIKINEPPTAKRISPVDLANENTEVRNDDGLGDSTPVLIHAETSPQITQPLSNYQSYPTRAQLGESSHRKDFIRQVNRSSRIIDTVTKNLDSVIKRSSGLVLPTAQALENSKVIPTLHSIKPGDSSKTQFNTSKLENSFSQNSLSQNSLSQDPSSQPPKSIKRLIANEDPIPKSSSKNIQIFPAAGDNKNTNKPTQNHDSNSNTLNQIKSFIETKPKEVHAQKANIEFLKKLIQHRIKIYFDNSQSIGSVKPNWIYTLDPQKFIFVLEKENP
nr:hypothetical protein [Pseudobdellovibrionaceae bacterium]